MAPARASVAGAGCGAHPRGTWCVACRQRQHCQHSCCCVHARMTAAAGPSACVSVCGHDCFCKALLCTQRHGLRFHVCATDRLPCFFHTLTCLHSLHAVRPAPAFVCVCLTLSCLLPALVLAHCVPAARHLGPTATANDLSLLQQPRPWSGRAVARCVDRLWCRPLAAHLSLVVCVLVSLLK